MSNGARDMHVADLHMAQSELDFGKRQGGLLISPEDLLIFPGTLIKQAHGCIRSGGRNQSGFRGFPLVSEDRLALGGISSVTCCSRAQY